MRRRAANARDRSAKRKCKKNGSPDTGPNCAPVKLRGAAPARGYVPQRPVDQGTVQRIEMGEQRSDLGEKRIGKDRGHFLFPATAGVPHELAHFDLKRICQPLERTQGRDRLPILNFRDIGTGDLHAARQLPLAQMACTANLTHLPSYLQPCFSCRRDRLTGDQLRGQGGRLLNVKGPSALSAERVAGSVLHQAAEIAAHDFSRFHTYKGGGHRLVAERQSMVSAVLFCTVNGVTVGGMNHNCQVQI
jgi:hypothetical protein